MIRYQDCSSHLDSSKNMAARGRGLFSLYIYMENLKNLLVRNHWTYFHIILQKCSFDDPLPRLFKPFGFVKKHGRQGAGLISSPEHEVLMVSYCGQSMSVVRRPSCVVRRPSCGVNNCFKSRLLLHPWAN